MFARRKNLRLGIGGKVIIIPPQTVFMKTDESSIAEWWNPDPKPAWANVWHLWTVRIPRRTMTGKLVCGRVWRRYDGRKWIYKRFAEFENPDY